MLPRNPICNMPGQCVGSTSVGVTFPQNVEECQKDCKDNKECLYFTYYQEGKYCNQFDGCKRFETDCKNCLTWEVSCPDDIQIVDDRQYQCNLNGMCLVSPKLCNHVPSLDHMVIWNSVDFPCWKLK